jgi:hypothetical protein
MTLFKQYINKTVGIKEEELYSDISKTIMHIHSRKYRNRGYDSLYSK